MGGAESADQKPPKAWEIGAWVGLFCDPYADGVLGVGEVAACVGTLAELIASATPKLTLWDDEGRGHLSELRAVLGKINKLAIFATKSLKDPDALCMLIEGWVEELRGLPIGGYTLVPCGWKDGLGADNSCILVVEKIEAKTAAPTAGTDAEGPEASAGGEASTPPAGPFVRVVFINTAEGTDVYHPASLNAAPASKVRRKTGVLLGELPLDKVMDPAFLAMLLTQRRDHETHKVELTYDALLPWLVDQPTIVKSLAACAGDKASDWRTPARSKTSGFKSLMEAGRYMLRRKGVTSECLKQLSLQLRSALLAKAVTELQLMADPGAARSPAALAKCLAELPLVDGTGSTLNGSTALAGKQAVGLYFSAHWCPPCRGFTPRLCETYRKLREKGEMGFEVIFISRDQDQPAFNEYFGEMPWLAVPFGNPAIDNLVDKFEVRGIPSLAIVSPEGELLNLDGRSAVQSDPVGANFPWKAAAAVPAAGDAPLESITPSDRVLLSLGARQLARAALKEQSCGRLQGGELAEIEGQIAECDRLAVQLEKATDVGLPPPLNPQVAALAKLLGDFDLLCGTGEDIYRGQRVTPPPPPLANMLDLPLRAEVDCFEAILDALNRCKRITDALLSRARDTGGGANATSASRLAIQGQVISIIQGLFTEVIPLPLPPGVARDGSCPWTVHPVTRAKQLEALNLIFKLMHRLAEMWQDIEEPPRVSECVRATAGACAFAMFDCVIRQVASDKPLELSVLLGEGDGFALSTGVGRMRGLDFEKASEKLELMSPPLVHARADALAYFSGVKATTGEAIFEMPIVLGGEAGLVIQLEKYGPTCVFLLSLMERYGYPIIPEGNRPQTEMDSVMMWFGSHPEQESAHSQLGKEHPEWMLLRDAATIYKFLYSMLPLAKENMTVRKEVQDFRGHLPLSFSPGTGKTGGRMESLEKVMWQTQTVFGAHKQTANIVGYCFYNRKITWGDGATLKSPANVGSMVDRDKPTEEDILHCSASQLKKARFDGTLSTEEAESLLTCMVAPYVRIPLVAHFFADLTKEPSAGDAFRCGNRASFLFNDRLQALFQASILEQGTWVPEASKGMVVRVPMRRTARQQEEYRALLDKDARRTAEAKSLGSPFGLLLNELKCSPDGTLRPLIEILRYTQEVAHCSLHSTSATFTLFILSVGIVVELFGLEAKQELEAAGVHISPLLSELGELLRGPILDIMDKWIDEASKEVSTDGKRVGNLPTLAVLHAFRSMLFAPRIAGGSCDAATAANFVGSLAYVRGHHCYGQQLRNSELTAEEHAQPELVEKKLLDQLSKFLQSQGFEASQMEQGYLKKFITGAPVWFVHEGICIKVPLAGMSERSQGFMAPPAEVPEMMISDVLTLVRRPLVTWMEALDQEELGKVLSDVVWCALGSSHSVPTVGWEKTAGHPGLYCIPEAGVICDVQGAEILYQSEELRPVPDSMSSFSDFEHVFGREALQCAFRFTHEHRRWVDIIGEEHELLEWDAPTIDAQGIGAPSPLPGVVFQDPSMTGPPATDVLDALCSLKVTDHEGNVTPALEALAGVSVIGIYFSAHWCPPCRGFTPKFGSTYKALEESKPGQLGVIFVTSDRGEEEFKSYFDSMPWKYAVPYADGASRQKLGELFGIQGIPSLSFVTPTGHVVAMNGREKVSEDPTGQKFPWGSLEPKPVPEGPKEDAITYIGVRYNRPFVWYHPGKVFPAPPPDPEPTEAWAVEILQPVLEALFPACPPDKRMTYVLYMPEAPLAQEADELVLIGMSDEDKAFATWKEIHVHKHWQVVHCYNLLSHGRRMFRTLVWSSHGARCLHTLAPMHLKPSCCPVPPVILDASGDWKAKRLPDPSLVIVRQNHDVGGRETFLPPRLLAGVVPGAFLDAYAFWQTEDLTIRGYPINPKDEWFPYALEITLIPGSGAQIVRCDPSNLSVLMEKTAAPELARVVSAGGPVQLRRERSAGLPPQMRRELSGGPASPADGGSPMAPAQPVLSRNKSTKSRLAPLTDMGFSEEMAQNALDAARGPDGRENYDLAVSMLTGGDMPMPLARVAEDVEVVPPPVTVPPVLAREKSAFGGVAGSGKMTSERRQQDAAKNELVLMDLFRSPADSFLHCLAKAFARIEDLGHVLVWGGALDPATKAHKIARIELPRLKLRFQVVKMADGTVRVCSTDHDGWFLADIDLGSIGGAASQPARTQLLVQLLQGIPHCLLLENATKELQLLVPAWELRRPKEKGAPFGTHLIFNRGSDAWTEIFSNTRCFLYPVHATRAFLMPKSLDALLYLVLLRFYGRQYDAAHKWATSIAVDVPFASTELWVFKQFKHVKDGHPDANALRLRLTIAVRFSPDAESMDLWESHLEFDSYLAKVPHVSAGCALTPLEELQGIKMLKEMTPNLKIRKKILEVYNSGAAALEIGAPEPQVGGEPWNKMVTVSKELFEEREWLKRFKFKIPTEEGGLGLRDGEALMPIFESMLMDDDEVGNTRQLGFVFLYALAIGQLPIEVNGKQCGPTMAQILTRSFQLKLAHWGKRSGEAELQAKLSKQCAVLSMIFDHPTAGWPRLPLQGSDVPAPGKYTFTGEEIAGAVAALAEGVNVDGFLGLPADEEEEGDKEEDAKMRGQMAMWNWHVDLKDVVRKLFEARMVDVYRTGRREVFKNKRAEIEAWACVPQTVDFASPAAAVLVAQCLPPFKPFDTGCERYPIAPFQRLASPDGIPFTLPDGVDLSLTSDGVQEFAGMPLGSAAGDTLIESTPAPGPEIEAKLSFPLAKHPAALSAIAVDMLARLEKDLGVYKKDQRDKRDVRLRTMGPEDLKAICAGEMPGIDAAIKALEFLLGSLAQAYESGMQYVENAVSMAVTWADYISDGGDADDSLARCQFRLKQRGGLVLKLSYEALIATSLSTKALDDLSRFNPFLQNASDLMPLIAATELYANRIAQTARTLTAIRSLKQQLAVIKQNGRANPAQSLKVSHSVTAVATQLGARRYCLELAADGASGELDPRLLVFEFLSSFLLRERQVQMVRDLKGRALQGFSSCQQMIMGAGKTTVVGPLLVLCLADGATAVLQTMPSALLEMTRNVLREVFAYPLAKQVFTLTFDRTQDKVGPVRAIIEKLELAMKNRGVVVAAPESIKSLTLKMIELCHSLDEHGTVSREQALQSKDGRAAREQFDALEEMVQRTELADACSKVLSLWKQGVVIMDEVDVLLHPLRSELNFPIGEKVPVDLSGERWELPIHLLSLVFIDELDLALATESDVEKAAWKEAETKAGESRADVAKVFRAALEKGVSTFSFMTLPHLVLMDAQFYEQELAVIAARFCLLWIHRLAPDNITAIVPNSLLLSYLTGKSDLASEIVDKLRPETMKMLNLAADWVLSYLPHVLSRVNRVSYGLLSEHDKQPASAPESRRLMAVPFLAKDVPSRNSEFAHPDIVIGFTILAFRHEGLRTEDMHRIVKQLKGDFARQIGPRSGRPANILFEEWLSEGRETWSRVPAATGTPPSVLNLELFQPEEGVQMANLQMLLTKRPKVVHHYLTRMVFPDTMLFHRLKVSACGHELGSDMIFARRIGFSGTPSNLLPIDLQPCTYEPGSDGKIIEVLTDPSVVSTMDVPTGWDAKSLLGQVATAEPAFHALIDTGALVTGLESAEVADILLQELPAWFEGVVYLDKSDRQMVLLRSSGRSAPLQQCGLPLDKRFTFYDQIHTTGMDIKQAPNARAALTVGKDMVFRDYAQGAWRMRGIGIGQTISLMIIPEVQKKIQSDLQVVPGLFVEGGWESNVPAWLLVNSMRSEGLQEVQLNLQELHNVYRKRALTVLQDDSAFADTESPEDRCTRFTADTERAKKLHAAIQVFREVISNEIDAVVPKPKTLREVFDEKVVEYTALGAKELLGVDATDESRLQQVRARTAGGSKEEAKVVRGGMEATRQQQQEQEQQQQQMKEREQEEEQMTQFCRDEEGALPWFVQTLAHSPGSGMETAMIEAREAGKSFPFSSLMTGDAFYPMAIFHATENQPQLPFPRNLLLSTNYFRPRWAGMGDRRLKNISLVVEWQLGTPPEDRRFLVVPSLSEAETIRRLIHNGEYGVYDKDEGITLEKKPLSVALAVRTLAGHKLDSTPSFRDDVGAGSQLQAGLQCLRFFHGDMFFSDEELRMLMSSLSAASPEQRKDFFEECLRRRRRERREWTDTPIARVFVPEEEWAILRPRALVEQVTGNVLATLSFVDKKTKEKEKLEEVAISFLSAGDEEKADEQSTKIQEIVKEIAPYPKDIRAIFEMFDIDKDDALSRTEMTSFLKGFDVHPMAADVQGVLTYLGTDGTSFSWVLFEAAFAPKPGAAEDMDIDMCGPWVCRRCQLPNLYESITCVYCQQEPRPDLATVMPDLGGPGRGQWECGTCHFYNVEEDAFCSICSMAKGSVAQGDFE